MDMGSGGTAKIRRDGKPVDYVYIEAPEAEAREIFRSTFDEDPDWIACSCCGSNFSVDEESDDLAQATAYERKHTPLDEWIKKDSVIVIRRP
jgi:hypothetical protein